MEKNISDYQIWHKIINELEKAKVKYVLVGGAALVVHGLPRSTMDIDIYIPAKEKTLYQIFQVADYLGLQSEEKDILSISRSPELFTNQWICFSYKNQDILDVFLAKENEFNRLYKNSEKKGDRTAKIRVASLNDIKRMKKASSRPIDLADINFIK